MDFRSLELFTLDSLKRLYDNTGYFSNGDIKDAIVEVQNYLKNISDKIPVCEMLVKPFLLGASCDGKLRSVSLEYLSHVYKISTVNGNS